MSGSEAMKERQKQAKAVKDERKSEVTFFFSSMKMSMNWQEIDQSSQHNNINPSINNRQIWLSLISNQFNLRNGTVFSFRSIQDIISFFKRWGLWNFVLKMSEFNNFGVNRTWNSWCVTTHKIILKSNKTESSCDH